MVVIKIRARIGFGGRCAENMVDYDRRNHVVSMCDTLELSNLFRAKYP